MRPLRPARLLLLLAPMVLAAGMARAEFSLFGSAERTPANPFASNYASPPVRGSTERPRRVRRAPPSDMPKPPREIPRRGDLAPSKRPRPVEATSPRRSDLAPSKRPRPVEATSPR